MFKIPKNDFKYHWTQHAIRKMAFYGLSPDRVRRIIRNPKRIEAGIAENTIAVMVPRTRASSVRGKSGTKQEEIWTMYQKRGSKKVVISAWRYPGVSLVGKQIPIPADILEELKNEGTIK